MIELSNRVAGRIVPRACRFESLACGRRAASRVRGDWRVDRGVHRGARLWLSGYRLLSAFVIFVTHTYVCMCVRLQSESAVLAVFV